VDVPVFCPGTEAAEGVDVVEGGLARLEEAAVHHAELCKKELGAVAQLLAGAAGVPDVHEGGQGGLEDGEGFCALALDGEAVGLEVGGFEGADAGPVGQGTRMCGLKLLIVEVGGQAHGSEAVLVDGPMQPS
jgi:hypothetical protein